MSEPLNEMVNVKCCLHPWQEQRALSVLQHKSLHTSALYSNCRDTPWTILQSSTIDCYCHLTLTDCKMHISSISTSTANYKTLNIKITCATQHNYQVTSSIKHDRKYLFGQCSYLDLEMTDFIHSVIRCHLGCAWWIQWYNMNPCSFFIQWEVWPVFGCTAMFASLQWQLLMYMFRALGSVTKTLLRYGCSQCLQFRSLLLCDGF